MWDFATGKGHEARTLYLRALDPEGPLPLGTEETRRLRAALADVPEDGEGPDALIDEVRRWGAEETERFRGVLTEEAAARCVLLNCAPLALSAGAWLQWLSSAGNGEQERSLRILALYASDVGVGYPRADRGGDYRALLRRHRIEEETPGVRLAAAERIESFSFRLPGLLLAMSRLPDEFLPEIMGADLCLRAVGVPPPLAALDDRTTAGTDARALDLGAPRRGESESAFERSHAVARLLAEERPDERPRLSRGFRWAARELGEWCGRLLDEAALTRHPDYDVWRLICSRARQAAVYHGDHVLEGRTLADWFANVDEGPGPFLGALARSRLVRPGRSDASPLVRGLIGDKGPMFRIFTADDVAVLRRWIDRLPDEGSVLHGPSEGHEGLHEAQRSWYLHDGRSRSGAATVPRRSAAPVGGSLRAAYHALLGRADSPGLRRFAQDYTARWLIRSRHRLERAPVRLPPRWDSVNGLRTWLYDEHDRHGRQFEESEPPIPSREELVDSTLQLAPLIMIDGGWLQGFTDHQHASSPSGHFLFRTYWDELGNGVRELNHPRIYRALLRDMGVEPPPTDSREFAAWPGFRDEAFALPVYWLSISRFPQSRMPEILGLNLAMELSGVGSGYRSSRVALKHYGFSTQFVDLHNTIDNVATGHSAWAVDAIDSYMADVSGTVGPRQESEIWERIRTGHRSLNPPDGTVARLHTALWSRRTRGNSEARR
ncbi:iron-containing redox enzyme family protein [Thermomonospora umbrina]|uniref:Heme oxygenase-like protein n=1 Tax=Thermomonospora umbrina TaxID=111806 RepID=A0A3D9SP79_9ACTN|nr:iron-containing redox enzyme family protein [Thermomonospora umbrina]REE96250.1 heme oxygenase-like protein [Thermomonospora umbrina]